MRVLRATSGIAVVATIAYLAARPMSTDLHVEDRRVPRPHRAAATQPATHRHRPTSVPTASPTTAPTGPRPTVSVSDCGMGGVRGRAALAHGLVLAARLGRDAVLTPRATMDSEGAARRLEALGMRVAFVAGQPRGTPVALRDTLDLERANLTGHEAAQLAAALNKDGVVHALAGCAVDSVGGAAADVARYDEALGASPSRRVAEAVDAVVVAIGGAYTALHAPDDDTPAAATLDNTLAIEGVPTTRPLFVASAHALREMRRVAPLVPLLERYTVITKDAVLLAAPDHDDAEDAAPLSASELQAVDELVCLRADLFVGDAASAFSARIFAMRQSAPATASRGFSYRTPAVVAGAPGDPPHPPPAPLKWVFTVDEATADDLHDDLVLAVSTALNRTDLIPVCVWRSVGQEQEQQQQKRRSSPQHPLYQWLTAVGVRLVTHEPKWADRARAALLTAAVHSARHVSPLYRSETALVGALLRLDLPVLGFVDRHVLYTDTDVMFRAPPPPVVFHTAVGSAVAFVAAPPTTAHPKSIDSGVMLVDMALLRLDYHDFVEYVFSRQSLEAGLSFGDYGTLADGAYASFYEGRFATAAALAGAPPDEAALVHFAGPGRRGYEAYLSTGALRDEARHGPALRRCAPFNSTLCYAVLAEAQAAAPLRPASARRAASAARSGLRSLSFSVCGGLTNQRIAILHGFMLGHLTKRRVVLPRLLSTYDDLARTIPFGELYNLERTAVRLKGIVEFETRLEADFASSAPVPVHRKLHGLDGVVRLNATVDVLGAELAVLDCAFFALDIASDPALVRLFWLVNEALEFTSKITAPADALIAKLAAAASAENTTVFYTALHYRAEADWLKHCATWGKLRTRGTERHDADRHDNCLTNTDRLADVFALEGLNAHVGAKPPPLFVAGAYTAADVSAMPALSALRATRQLYTKDALLPELFDEYSLANQREILAAIDYVVCRNAPVFVGNSVSSFAAFIILEREHNTLLQREPVLRSVHYNGGDVPLRRFCPPGPAGEDFAAPPPVLRKWVFTLSGHSRDYDVSAAAAVASALSRAALVPVCVWLGPQNNMTAWLRSVGVVVLPFPQPSWQGRLRRAYEAVRKHPVKFAALSPLYRTEETMLATFMRIDLPTFPIIDKYVLYTDVDVVFRDRITLATFGKAPPKYYAVGTEADGLPGGGGGSGVQYGNAGVMLMNLQGLRDTRKAFLEATFSFRSIANGLHYGKFGPGDQGAYNSFYQGKFNLQTWPAWNHKPYWPWRREASILHFHGPKPRDYAAWFASGRARTAVFRPLLARCRSNATKEDLWAQGLLVDAAKIGCGPSLKEYDRAKTMAFAEYGAAAFMPSTETPEAAKTFRVLVYGLPSSGVSLFALLLCQNPQVVGVPHLYAGRMAPSPAELDIVPAEGKAPVAVVVKAVVSTAHTVDDLLATFRPNAAVLVVRNPPYNRAHLRRKEWRDKSGALDEKLARVEDAFVRRKSLFNATVAFEDILLLNDTDFRAAVAPLRLPVDPSARRGLVRTAASVAEDAVRRCGWCRDTKDTAWSVGRAYAYPLGLSLNTSLATDRRTVTAKDAKAARHFAPALSEHYRRLRPMMAVPNTGEPVPPPPVPPPAIPPWAHDAQRRVLVTGSLSSGASLVAYALAQRSGSVGVPWTRPGAPWPYPSQLGLDATDASIRDVVLRVPLSALALATGVFKPHVRLLVLRHPSVLHAAARRRSGGSAESAAVSLRAAEQAFGAREKVDAVVCFEELLLAATDAEIRGRLVRSLGRLDLVTSAAELEGILLLPHSQADVTARAVAKSGWARREQQYWGLGPAASKLGSRGLVDEYLLGSPDYAPTTVDKTSAARLAPGLASFYDSWLPGLCRVHGGGRVC